MRTALRLACAFSIAQHAFLAAGCKSAEDRAPGAAGAPAAAPAAAEMGKLAPPDAGKRTITLGGDGGGSGLLMGSTKPVDFPKDIPLYPGSTVALGGRSTGTGKPSWSLTVTTADSKDQAIARYRELLSGFEKVTDLNMGDAMLSIWRSAAYDMTLMIGTAADGKTTVTLNVASK